MGSHQTLAEVQSFLDFQFLLFEAREQQRVWRGA
jgi:hypothetical protein